MIRDSLRMRTMLADAGIFLDNGPADETTDARQVSAESAPDRDQIRAVLVERGAPAAHLDWLTASCPSIDDAMTYNQPRRTI